MNTQITKDLLFAIENNLYDLVKICIEKGADIHVDIHTIDTHILHWASRKGCFETVKLLLDKGADIHAGDDCAFCSACCNGHIETVKLLLSRGANIHAKDNFAIFYTSQNNHLEIVNLLKEYMKKETETITIGKYTYNKKEIEEKLKDIKPL